MTLADELAGKLSAALSKTTHAENLRRHFTESGFDIWLVGGATRNVSLGRRLADVDLVVNGDPVPAASGFARDNGLSYVTLDEKRRIARIVLKPPDPVMFDISRMNGESIEADLSRRDFTINAIAAKWNSDRIEITDPLGGLADLDSGVLRPASPSAFADDPVRIVRAYRFACVCKMKMEKGLRNLMRRSLGRLPPMPQERVSREIFHILNEPDCHTAIADMAQDNALETVFPEMGPMRGVLQNRWHHLDVFDHTLATLARLDDIAMNPPQWAGGYLRERVSYDANRLAVTRLAALYHDAGKPHCAGVSARGEVCFIGHENTSAKLALTAARRLRVPREIARGWRVLVKNHLRPLNAAAGQGLSRRGMYRFCRDLGQWDIAALVHAMADSGATCGPAVTMDIRSNEKRLIKNIIEFKNSMKVSAQHARPPVDGNDLMRELGVEPGPVVGMILEKLAEAAATENIRDRNDAFRLASDILKNLERPYKPEMNRGEYPG